MNYTIRAAVPADEAKIRELFLEMLRDGMFRLFASRERVHRLQRSVRQGVSCGRKGLSDLCLLRQ